MFRVSKRIATKKYWKCEVGDCKVTAISELQIAKLQIAETSYFTNDLHEALLHKSNQGFWKFGNLSFLMLLLTLFRLMVLLTVPLLPPISRGTLNQHVSHSVQLAMRPLKPNIMHSGRNIMVRH